VNAYLLALLATLATTGRVLGLILLSVVTGWFLGYAAIKSRVFENAYIASIEVLESVPVISFFPVVLIFFINDVGGGLGVELAADFLVFTAVVWNIWVGIYQAFKTIPNEMLEVTKNFEMSFLQKLRYAYIPFSVPRIAANLFPSLADGFFYITVSEVLSVGTTSYSTFGIGTVIDRFSSQGDFFMVYVSLIFIGAAVVLTVLGMREFSKYAVAKYALDTNQPIRKGRGFRISSLMSKNPFQKLSFYSLTLKARTTPRRKGFLERPEEEEKQNRLSKIVPAAVGFLLLALLIYGAVSLVIGVSPSLWSQLLSMTPYFLYSMLVDYARVGVITLVSLALAITVGYYLAVHARAEASMVPLIQSLSAFPAPTYFPVLFALTVGLVRGFLGPYTVEFYVLLVGFISTFYYIFYSFWMGIRAMPQEYWDVMDNLNMGFFQKMRHVLLPATFPYIIAGISSTVNSAWGGLMIGEYWPDIYKGYTLTVRVGLMKLMDVYTAEGQIALVSWASLLFGIVVVVYSIFFTRKMMDLARKKYVAEEGVYAARRDRLGESLIVSRGRKPFVGEGEK